MRKKLLVLTPRFPYPPIGGDRLRIYQVCKHLAQDFDLTLLSLCSSRDELTQTLDPDGIFTRIERVLHPCWRRLCGCMSVFPSTTPLQIGYYRNSEFTRRLHTLISEYDGALAHLIRTADYLRPYPLPKFLEMTDCIARTYMRTQQLGVESSVWRFAYGQDAKRLLEYERTLIHEFDLSVLVSHEDRDFLVASKHSEKTLICPNGVDTSAFAFDYSPDGKTIVFIANVTSYQNIDAILHFAQDIFPKILQRAPQAKLKVVGRISDEVKCRLERHPRIRATGQVDSIAAATRGSTVGVCPIRFGTGVQNKLLEYMALGIPAVTSPIGLEGLRAEAGVHLLAADSAEDWVNHICWLLETPEHGRELAEAARDLVEHHYSWASFMVPLRESIAERLGQDRGTKRVLIRSESSHPDSQLLKQK